MSNSKRNRLSIVAYVDPPVEPEDYCSGCRICELVCAFAHEKTSNPKKARIRVVHVGLGIDYPIVCRQCSVPKCAEKCPTDAIMRNENTGLVSVVEEKCIGCGVCIESCPFGAITLHPDKGTALLCDLCGGDPQCVKYCPAGLLRCIPKKSSVLADNTARAYVRKISKGKGDRI